MVWICPKCGNKNKDELNRCILCHFGKLDDLPYQKRVYMDRVKPTYGSIKIIAGIIMLPIGAYAIAVAFTSDDVMDKFIGGLLGFGFMWCGLMFIKDTLLGQKAMDEFEKGATVTNAVVISRYIKEEINGGYGAGGMSMDTTVIYYIVVRFEADGKQYVIDAKVSKKLYKKAGRNKLLSLTYSNLKPWILLFEGEY